MHLPPQIPHKAEWYRPSPHAHAQPPPLQIPHMVEWYRHAHELMLTQPVNPVGIRQVYAPSPRYPSHRFALPTVSYHLREPLLNHVGNRQVSYMIASRDVCVPS